MEAVVLHAAGDGTPAAAHICRGAGSFEAVLASLGEPLPEPEAAAAPAAAPPEAPQQDLPQAATVS